MQTRRDTDYEEKLKIKAQTSGCAQGTVFGDIMDEFRDVELNRQLRVKTSWLHALQKKVNSSPSLYLKTGAFHGCVLCKEDKPLIYIKDVGGHNAVDKIAGHMFLNDILSQLARSDMILVEGYKAERFPKIEIRSTRSLTQEKLPRDKYNIVPVASDRKGDTDGLPLFNIDDVPAIADFIADYLRLKL